jgi:MFS family permease
MLAADITRAVAVGMIVGLSLAGVLRLWHIVSLAAVYSVGTAFFAPASDAIVPEILPDDMLAQANALDQFMRPIALRLAGPALGGLLISTFGAGVPFVLDAGSFMVSAAVLVAMTRRLRVTGAASRSVGREIRAGFSYVRRHAWLWATLGSAAIAYLLFMGPTEVLVPFIVKNGLHGSAADLGLVFAAGGVGSLVCAVMVGQRGCRSGRSRGCTSSGRWRRSRSPVTAWLARCGVDARKPRVQLVRNDLDDHLEHGEAAPRAGSAARQGFEPRLADLDRADAALVCARCTDQRRDRSGQHADLRRRDRQRRDPGRPVRSGRALDRAAR